MEMVGFSLQESEGEGAFVRSERTGAILTMSISAYLTCNFRESTMQFDIHHDSRLVFTSGVTSVHRARNSLDVTLSAESSASFLH